MSTSVKTRVLSLLSEDSTHLSGGRQRKIGKNVYRLTATILDTKPPVWRRLVIRDDSTLAELHDVTSCHLSRVPSVGRSEVQPCAWSCGLWSSAPRRRAGSSPRSDRRRPAAACRGGSARRLHPRGAPRDAASLEGAQAQVQLPKERPPRDHR